jgi:TolA-binding protein
MCAIALFLSSPGQHSLAQDSRENSDFKLAVNLFNDRMYDLAAQQFKQFIAAYPNTSQGIESRFYLGQVQMQLKQYDDARTTFQNFALSYVEHPRAPEAWLNVGYAFEALGNEREAALAFERVKVFHPTSPLIPEALLKAGEMRRNLGEREAAKQVLRSLIQSYPESKQVVSARLMIGELYAGEGQIDLAEEEARRVSSGDAPPAVRAAALYSIARFQAGASLFSSAESTLNDLLRGYATSEVAPLAAIELGKIELLSGLAKQAAGRLQPVVTRKGIDDSLKAEALFFLGRAQFDLKQFSGAGESWEKIVSGHPSHHLSVPARLMAAKASNAGKNFKHAIDLLSGIPASAGSADRSMALHLSAEASIGLKRTGDALRTLKILDSEFPDDPRTLPALFSLGEMYRDELRDEKNALRIFEQIVEEYPGSALADDALFAAAGCEESLGDDRDAVARYGDLRSRYPASDRFVEAGRRMDFLESHKIRNRDVGMGKLAQLLGGVLSEKPTPMLAYQLGEIYFQDLKDYGNAAKQFENALKGGLGEDETEMAAFMKARSYHLLSETDPGAAATASDLYAAFVARYPASGWTPDALFFALTLTLEKGEYEAAMNGGAKFLREHPDSPHAEQVIMSLGDLALGHDQPAEAARYFRLIAGTESPRRDEARYGLGRSMAARGMPDSAAAQWRMVVGTGANPRITALALSDLAAREAETKKFRAAADLMRTLATEYGYSALGERARVELPGMLYAAGAYQEVISLLQSISPASDSSRDLLTGTPDLPALLILARSYDRTGNKELALACFHRYLHSGGLGDPGVSEAYYELGNLAREQGRTRAASAYFAEASARGASGRVSTDIAELLFDAGQYAEAVKQFRSIADSAKEPDARRDATARLIVSNLRLDRIKAADNLVTAFEKQFGKHDRYRAEFGYERAMSWYRAREYTKAKDLFEKVNDDYGDTPQAPWAGFYVAKIAEITGGNEKAMKGYQDVVRKYPASDVKPRALLSIGNFHFNAEKYEEAIGVYQQITASPETAGEILPYAMTNLIEAYESVKLYENALQTARDFIARYPNDPSIIAKKIKVGALYTKIGYYDQAVFQFQGLLSEAGSAAEAELRYDIGEAYYYKGEYQQAILEFLRVPYLPQGSGNVDWTATSFYMAGQSYEKMMKFDEAIGMYQQVIDRPGIDATFKAAARKEIDRVKLLKNN